MRYLILTVLLSLSTLAHAQKFKGKYGETMLIEQKGAHVALMLSTGYGFEGDLIEEGAPLFFSTSVHLPDGTYLDARGSGKGCRFTFTDHGGFSPGWESRFTGVMCGLRGRPDVRFDIAP
jgi:hypothetical protein